MPLRERAQEFDDIFDFRLAVESAAARLAAERRTEQEVRLLQEAIHSMKRATDRHSFRKVDSEFHLGVAEAGRNTLLKETIELARAAMFLPIDALDYEVARETSIRQHLRVLRSIQLKEAKNAERAMAAHIESTRAELHKILSDPELE